MSAVDPAARVVLHVGPMKSGTTYLQSLLYGNRAILAEAAVLASVSVAGPTPGLLDLRARSTHTERSDRLVARVRSHRGVSVLSHEFLSWATTEQASAVVAALGVPVQVVFTVRDARTLPASMWQTAARNVPVEPWPDFARELAAGPSPARRFFRRRHGLAGMLRTWTGAVGGADRVAVVTVPPRAAGEMELWRRFTIAGALGDPEGLRSAGLRNESLGYPSAEVVRQVVRLLGRVEGRERRLIRQVLCREVLAARLDREPRVPTDAAVVAFGARWNAVTRKAIRELKVPVVGDPSSDLGTDPDASFVTGPLGPPDPAEVEAARGHALEGLARVEGAELLLDALAAMERPAR
ncbi:MAG: hypothetical protein QM655_11010 [Nocardioidaceae bacterium]